MKDNGYMKLWPIILVLALLATSGSIAGSQVPGKPAPPVLRPLYTVSGDVVDKQGNPVQDVIIINVPVDAPGTKAGAATTDSRGHFIKEGLAGNKEGYRLTPEKGGISFSPAQATVTGATTGLKFVMNK